MSAGSRGRAKAGARSRGRPRSDRGEESPKPPTVSGLDRLDPEILALFFTRVSLAFAVLSPELRFLKVNGAMCELFGYSEEELLGLDAPAVSHPDDRELSREPIEQALSSPDHTYLLEKRFLRKNGETVWVRLRATIVLDEQGRPLYHFGVAEDIGERRRAEQELETASERFRGAFEDAPIGMIVASLEGRILDANPALCALLGWRREELVGRPIGEITYPGDPVLDSGEIERSLQEGGDVYTLEKRYLHSDGHPVWTRVSLAVVKGPAGEPRWCIGHLEDIGERRRQEQALAEATQRFVNAFENSPIGMSIVDLDGRYLEVNPSLCRILGYSREQLLGRDFQDVTHPDDRVVGAEYMRAQLAGQLPPHWFEKRYLHSDGHDVWTRLLSSLVRDDNGRPLYFVTQIEDISERKRAERQLAEASERFAGAFEHAPIGMAVTSPNGEWLQVNPALCEMLGHTPEELLETTFQSFTHPDDQEASAEQQRRLLAGEVPAVHFEKRYLHADGHIVWARLSISLVRDESGRPLYFVTQIEDVSERRRMEDELRRAATVLEEAHELAALGSWEYDVRTNELYWSPALYRLAGLDETVDEPTLETVWEQMHPDDRKWLEPMIERAVACAEPFEAEYRNIVADGRERTMHLRGVVESDEKGIPTRAIGVVQDVTERVEAEAARRRLEAQMQEAQRLESLGVLAGGIAHDFNNLLVGILGNAGLIAMELPEGSPLRLLVDQVEIAARRAAELTKQMLAYSGRGQFVVRELDLRDLVRETAALLGSAVSKNVRIEFEFADQVPAVRADVAQMRQLIMNLITNASDAIGDSRGVIRVRIDASELGAAELAGYLFSEGLAETTYVSLEVADTGAGMDAETQAKIFDPFFTTKFGGHGLGLAAALGIVRGHHGAIKVSSAPGEGSRFSLLFPATDEAPAEAENASGDLSWQGTGTVLIVDDEEIVRRAAVRILSGGGLTVIESAGGEEALELLRRSPDSVDAALVDLIMPGMSGTELVEELRRLHPDLPVIFSSGYDARALAERAGGAETTRFLQKPYHAHELLDCVRELLSAG